MKLKDLYKKAVEAAIANDPRGRELIDREMEARRKDFEKLKDEDKEYFDRESLENPYSDSRILHGTGDEDIKGVIVGIDMEGPEVLLTHALREKGEPIDLVIAHHPEGRPYATLYDVMGMQADILGRMGVPINVAENLMAKRISEVERRLMPANHTRAVDTARLLNIPFACFHTLADNMVANFLQSRLDEEKPYRVSDIVEMLNTIPEYQEGRRQGSPPKVLTGSDRRTAGKVFVDMTGGTGGSKDIYESLSNSGVNTIVGMHIGEDHRKEAEKHHVNVVIAGHISSDNLGINLLLDELCKDEPLKIYECSGFRRFSRL